MLPRHRRSIRLPTADYAAEGTYFVTICTHEKQCVFGTIADEMMTLNIYGQIAHECWQAIPTHFPHVILDAFVVMPNHVHGIIVITEGANLGTSVGAQHAAPLQKRPTLHVVPGSLGAIVRSFKSATTNKINFLEQTPGAKLWQRNYYEHIIRNEADENRIRGYVASNPQNWTQDKLWHEE